MAGEKIDCTTGKVIIGVYSISKFKSTVDQVGGVWFLAHYAVVLHDVRSKFKRALDHADCLRLSLLCSTMFSGKSERAFGHIAGRTFI